MSISIQYTVGISIIWRIKGYDDYGFGTDKELYNIKRGIKKKKMIKNGMIGYWIGRRFISLTALRELIYKEKEDLLPF